MNAKAVKSTAPIADPPAEEAQAPATPLEEAIAEAPATPIAPDPDTDPTVDLSLPPDPQKLDPRNHQDTTNPEEVVQPDVKPEAPNVGLGVEVIGGGVEAAPTPVGVTQPIVPPVEDLAQVATNTISPEALAKFDETDSARAAAIRSQQNWVGDAARIFKGPDRAEVERQENLLEMDRLGRIEQSRVAQEEAAKARREAIAGRKQRLLDLDQEYEALRDRAKLNRKEREELELLVAEDDAAAPVEPVVPEPEKEAA